MIELTVNSKQFQFMNNIPGNVIDTLARGKFYEQKMLSYIAMLDPENTVVDVGANIGNHAIYMNSFTNCEEVIAFEAHPTIFQELIENISANNAEKSIKAYNLAIGDKKGKVSMDDGSPGQMGRAKVKKGNDIDMTTLDEFLKGKKVSLMKIDVEGFEPKVLLGAKKILKNQSPNLFVEAQTKQAKEAIDKILLPMGYKPRRVFNKTATYFYKKQDYSLDFTPIERIKNSFYHLQKNRIFRVFH